jgi:hypothetical protein
MVTVSPFWHKDDHALADLKLPQVVHIDMHAITNKRKELEAKFVTQDEPAPGLGCHLQVMDIRL